MSDGSLSGQYFGFGAMTQARTWVFTLACLGLAGFGSLGQGLGLEGRAWSAVPEMRVTARGGEASRSISTTAKTAWYCPFCTALKPTLTEEIEATDAVVFAKVLGPGQLTEDGFDRKLRMEVRQILKGKSFVAVDEVFETIAPASLEAGQECLVMGVLTDRMMWSTPMKLTDRSREYILAVQSLPLEGPDRIRFFLHYLEDGESFMAYDAYDEFARTPYDDVKAIKSDMNRDKLIGWVQDPEVSINRKRLYFTLLGVCGSKDDLPLLEKMITSSEKRDRAALDSLVACYLTLSGADGVKLIEDRFLRDKEADYVDTYAAVAALRFHGTESDVIPVPRIVEAVRLLLDRPEVADLVIADLARWKDWSVTDRLVEMFKNADDKTQWVRVPIIHYLRVNPNPIAKAKIEELKAIDPQSVRRALAFFELEAAMQTDVDEEDADFERQLKELEREKTEEKKKEDKGKETGGSSPNHPETPDSSWNEAPAPLAEPESASVTTGVTTRQFVLRPAWDPVDLEGRRGPDLADLMLSDDGEQFVVFAEDSSTANEAAQWSPAESAPVEIVRVETGAASTPDAVPTSTPDAVPTSTPDAVPTSTPDAVPTSAPAAAPAAVQTAGLANSATPLGSVANPSASGDRTEGHFWWIVGVPLAVNALLLALSWSILNGSFGRLFC